MASTYSPSLKITLMGDGDQSGLWGQTTNTNLGTLIEQAITGVQSIVMSDANYTLSSLNGVTDEARNAVIVATGTNNAIRDIIPPVVKKLYIVANNTGGGYAVRVIGASGTGVSIPNGATQVVYCDGTNFIAASAAFVNGSVLGVTGGGTGLNTLTANNVILGNGTSSPTFVAPGTTGNVLTSNGTTWVSGSNAPEFQTGTRMTFNQTSAPTGWTKDTSVNDAAFRLVSGSVGSGGTVDFTTAFASQTPSITISSVSGSAGATTLSTPQIPSHNHSFSYRELSSQDGSTSFGVSGGDVSLRNSSQPATTTAPSPTIANTGGGGSHTHPFSFSSGSATSSAINLAVKYVDLDRKSVV
jgi:hypothetical protein